MNSSLTLITEMKPSSQPTTVCGARVEVLWPGAVNGTGLNSLEMKSALLRMHPGVLSLTSRIWLQVKAWVHRRFWRWTVTGGSISKRAFDVGASAAALILLFPLFLLIALMIKLEDGGPVLFAQSRVGQDGRAFRILKFRSMSKDAETRLTALLAQNQHREGVTFKIKCDPRVTNVGRWLRRLSLDELPQFFNVLTGEMSIVGPRPPLPREVAEYSLADCRRLLVKPGITCLWQVAGRSNIDFSGQVKLDVEYIERQSLLVDLKILGRTVPAVLTGRGAC